MKHADLRNWYQWVELVGDFWGPDGFPCKFSVSYYGKAIMEAIVSLPNSELLDAEQHEIEGLAGYIFSSFEGGLSAKEPCNQPAAGKAVQSQLRKLYKLTGDLAEHLSSLNKPAVEALNSEGFSFIKVSELISEKHEVVGYSFGLIDPSSPRISVETKMVARIVCEAAADVYEHVTENKATYSTSVVTSERLGEWPDFLGKIFKALNVKASVSSQVAALSKKRNDKPA